jgi:metal-responsive CopG/Arc/MetJ family transcriptional regulator
MSTTARLTISLPQSLLALTDEVASEKKISRSKLISGCLLEMAEKRKIAEMEEGYRAMADEHRQFTEMASTIAREVVPNWE